MNQATNAWWSLARSAAPSRRRSGADALWHAALGSLARRTRSGRWYLRHANSLAGPIETASALAPDALRAAIDAARARTRRNTTSRAATDEALCALAALAARTVGLTPHTNQIACALALLDGAVAELPTGEGKTLAIALAASILGWRGRGCHVLTANDYLARRDATDLAALFEAAGLTVGIVTSDTARDARRAAYATDIVYSTAREVAADYLRDQLATGPSVTLAATLAADMAATRPSDNTRLHRGLAAAIIDEADALLIDDAGTPLVLAGGASGETDPDADAILRADAFASTLAAGRDFRIDGAPPTVHLTARGRRAVLDTESTNATPDAWASPRRREELVELALHAREMLRKDEHYVVLDERVCIIDAHTGRLLPDRTWRAGLHQAVEAKEGLTPTPIKHTLARTPFQRYFARYTHLCGTTGTAREVRRELWHTYKLPVVTLASHQPCIRRTRRAPVSASSEAMIADAADRIAAAHADGRPVLVGTRSVEMSERVSAALQHAGVPHEVLNAVRHEDEARIIAHAGERSAITIATNMAGRGTDIRLGDGIAELGGLLVVCVETQTSARLERQLLGRAARQGDPGEGLVLRSVADEVMRTAGPWTAHAARRAPAPLRAALVALAQRASERAARALRSRVARDEDRIRESLEFAGADA